MNLQFLTGSLVGKTVECEPASISVGSHADNDLCIPDAGVSGIHAGFEIINGQWFIHDIDSTNGVFVNGQKVSQKVRLKNSDILQIGFTEIKFLNVDEAKRVKEKKKAPSPVPKIKKESPKTNSFQEKAAERRAARKKKQRKSLVIKLALAVTCVIVGKIFYPDLKAIIDKYQRPVVEEVYNPVQEDVKKFVKVKSLKPEKEKPVETAEIINEEKPVEIDYFLDDEEVQDEGHLDKYKGHNLTLKPGEFHSLLKKYCVDCHNPKRRKGDVDLTVFKDSKSFLVHYETLVDFFEQVETGSMPPEDERQMKKEEHELLTGFLGKTLYNMENSSTKQTGSTKIRRLTTYEYDNSVQAVTGLDLNLSRNFALDGGGGEGFNNDSSTLGVSPLQFEQYLQATEELSLHSSFDLKNGFTFSENTRPPISKKESVAKVDDDVKKMLSKLYPENFSVNNSLSRLMRAVDEFNQSGQKKVSLPGLASKYRLNIVFIENGIRYFTSAFDKSIIERDGLRPWFALKQKAFDEDDAVSLSKSYTQLYRKSLQQLENSDDKQQREHQKFVSNIDNIFSFSEAQLTKHISPEDLVHYKKLQAMKEFMNKGMSSRTRSTFTQAVVPWIKKLLYEAHRKPPEDREVQEMTKDFLTATYDLGVSAAARLFVIRTFINMKFIFRHESKTGRVSKVTDYELASRLSYFLWSQPPDDELLKLAGEKRLFDPEVLKAQVHRMIKNKKSSGLARYFAAQWLQFERILSFDGINQEAFPEFNKRLAQDMWRETALCFEYIVKGDRNVLEILDSNYTFLNGNLKKHYGLGNDWSNFEKVILKDRNRGGILGHASVLTATSASLRTSPILRGTWVISALLGTPTPPAPADVEPLPDEEVVSEDLTLKKQLEAHRNSPNCKGCHQRIDPIGFPLENYDVLGRWRERYSNAPIDATGELITGKTISGPQELKRYLLKNKDSFLKNMSRKLLGYALGRSIQYYDYHVINSMVKNLKENDYRFSAMVFEIVNSYQFQYKN
ncbi:MAG: DUF1592 domain-containing protein [Lentisphaerales bacterium]|nr:DUF1592 domain-containing protein [Lentisphaerales bacterium]